MIHMQSGSGGLPNISWISMVPGTKSALSSVSPYTQSLGNTEKTTGFLFDNSVGKEWFLAFNNTDVSVNVKATNLITGKTFDVVLNAFFTDMPGEVLKVPIGGLSTYNIRRLSSVESFFQMGNELFMIATFNMSLEERSIQALMERGLDFIGRYDVALQLSSLYGGSVQDWKNITYIQSTLSGVRKIQQLLRFDLNWKNQEYPIPTFISFGTSEKILSASRYSKFAPTSLLVILENGISFFKYEGGMRFKKFANNQSVLPHSVPVASGDMVFLKNMASGVVTQNGGIWKMAKTGKTLEVRSRKPGEVLWGRTLFSLGGKQTGEGVLTIPSVSESGGSSITWVALPRGGIFPVRPDLPRSVSYEDYTKTIVTECAISGSFKLVGNSEVKCGSAEVEISRKYQASKQTNVKEFIESLSKEERTSLQEAVVSREVKTVRSDTAEEKPPRVVFDRETTENRIKRFVYESWKKKFVPVALISLLIFMLIAIVAFWK